MKLCKKCNQEKELGQFSRARNTFDGYFTYCKECQRDYYLTIRSRLLDWRSKNKDKVAGYNKKYHATAKGKKAVLKGVSKYEKENPQKVNARHNAANRGLRKDHCEECGSVKKLQMHHGDYSKQYDVITLCYRCHSLKHGKIVYI